MADDLPKLTEVDSIFIKKHGGSPLNRILDFLIIHQEYDYSLKDISEFSGVGYSTLKKMKEDLIKSGWIINTRKVGKAEMYRLNFKDSSVKAFVNFYWSVINSELKIDNSKQNATNNEIIVSANIE